MPQLQLWSKETKWVCGDSEKGWSFGEMGIGLVEMQEEREMVNLERENGFGGRFVNLEGLPL